MFLVIACLEPVSPPQHTFQPITIENLDEHREIKYIHHNVKKRDFFSHYSIENLEGKCAQM